MSLTFERVGYHEHETYERTHFNIALFQPISFSSIMYSGFDLFTFEYNDFYNIAGHKHFIMWVDVIQIKLSVTKQMIYKLIAPLLQLEYV